MGNKLRRTDAKSAFGNVRGTIIGRDYRGALVLAAFEPVNELKMGIVAKIDLSEIQKPFITTIIISAIMAVIAISAGTFIFFKITDPIIANKLYLTIDSLEKAVKEVKTLRGIIPICSFCKKIRNDKGYWDQVDVYVTEHSEALFSHAICPECMEIHYSDIKIQDK